MQAILHHLFAHQTLDHAAAYDVMRRLGQGEYNASQIAAFLTVFRMRPLTVGELAGFRDALLDLCRPPDLGTDDVLDLCGTGGDGRNTFNISTIAAFVVAGAGYRVAKHGNYGVSSGAGSSNLLAHFGYAFTADPARLRRQLRDANICFLHAPEFHPAMRHAAPVRRELGVRTFFNMLGPLVNPARPRSQLVGVYSLELLRLYQYLWQQSGRRYALVHALDGYDEVSLTGPFKLITPEGEALLTPAALGFPRYSPAELAGGDTVAEAAAICQAVLHDAGTAAQRDVVVANAGLAIHCADPARALVDCFEAARTSLSEGRALRAFEALLGAGGASPESAVPAAAPDVTLSLTI